MLSVVVTPDETLHTLHENTMTVGTKKYGYTMTVGTPGVLELN